MNYGARRKVGFNVIKPNRDRLQKYYDFLLKDLFYVVRLASISTLYLIEIGRAILFYIFLLFLLMCISEAPLN